MTTNLKPRLLLVTALTLQACAGAKSITGDTSGSGGSIMATGVGGSIGTGSGGASGVHCTTTACVPALSTPLTWDVELAPPGSSSATFTQLTDVDLATAPLTLTASSPSSVAATFAVPTNATAPSSANVVLTVPSSIPGRPDPTFQAPVVTATGLTATVTVPAPLIRAAATATMALIPLPPADQQSPPYSFSVTLASTVQVSLPTDNLSISGALTTAIAAAPKSTFVAQAFQNGAQVSNAPLTAPSTGSTSGALFQLLLPSAVAANGAPLTIQLTPQSSLTDPWFVSAPIAPPFPAMLPTIMLPAYLTPSQFNVIVYGPEGMTNPVTGALVQAQALIGASTGGTSGSADFARSALTDATGTASLSLLPPSAHSMIDYDVAVIPPANSAYATQCLSPATANPSTVTLATIMLPLRAVMTGTVTDNHGYPVANVNVTATPGPTATCGSTPPSAGSTTTGADGTFSLPLDPGTYQLDYDPPSGAAAPRLTEPTLFSVAAGAEIPQHDVSLPAGGLVVGTAVAQDLTPLPSTTVRLYEPRCSGSDCTGPMRTPPWLRGQTVTDANGQFRVVVPLPD
jgi:Carboxypeptidase regulatory-like domain